MLNAKAAPATRFDTSVPSSGRAICQFSEAVASAKLLLGRLTVIKQLRIWCSTEWGMWRVECYG